LRPDRRRGERLRDRMAPSGRCWEPLRSGTISPCQPSLNRRPEV
jgi:hypothetical protein